MVKVTHQISCILFLLVPFVLSGCITTSTWKQNRTGILENGESIELKNELKPEDYIALTHRVTEKMLTSSHFQSWSPETKPLLVIAEPQYKNGAWSSSTVNLQDEIISTILDSDLARVIEESSLSGSYEYLVTTTITSASQSNKAGKFTYYTCTMKMFSISGEPLGEWQDKIASKGDSHFFF